MKNYLFLYQLFLSLGELQEKFCQLAWPAISFWLQTKLSLDYEPSRASLSFDYRSLYNEKRKIWGKEKLMQSLLSQPYHPPLPMAKSLWRGENDSVFPVNHTPDEEKKPSHAARGIVLEMWECYDQMSQMILTINELQASLTQTTDATYELQKESKIEKNKLIHELRLIKLRYNKLENKLDSAKEKLSKYNPRNVTKREKRRLQIQELEAENELWERQFETLNEKLEIA